MISFSHRFLDNGLHVIHHHDSATQTVAVNLLYDVGSRDESPDRTGLAHLMEHLMFTGSANAPDFDRHLQAAGGENNASTTADATNYYDVMPAQNVETALWLESDRLLSLNLSDHSIEVQKSVVIEEFKQRYINQPYGDLSHLTHGLAYTTHPYRYPTIGRNVDDIANVPKEVIRQFYRDHYAVNNLILCLSGNITEEQAFELAQKWFSDIAPSPVVERRLPVEPAQTEPRRLRVERNVPQSVFSRMYHMSARTDSSFPACDILTDVLSNGNSSRFYRHLTLETGLFAAVSAMVSGNLDPGLLLINGVVAPGITLEDAETAVDEELDRLFTEPVTDCEVHKYVNKHEASEAYESVTCLQIARRLCSYAQMGDLDGINAEAERYRRLRADDIMDVALNLLRPENSSTLLYCATN